MTNHRFVLGHASALLCFGPQLGCSGGHATLTMDIDPDTITLGESARITWQWKASNGGYCKTRDAWGGTGTRDAKGSEVVTPTEVGTLTYSLRCVEFNSLEEKKAS